MLKQDGFPPEGGQCKTLSHIMLNWTPAGDTVIHVR